MSHSWKLLFLILAVTLIGCAEDESIETLYISGYSYFPLESQSYFIYEVDSIFHQNPNPGSEGIHDTAQYFLKEVIGKTFLDAEEKESYEVLRYKRDSVHHDWQLTNVWFARLNPNNAERVEDNKRYIKMGFPITPDQRWDGNAKNVLEEWECEYDSIQVAKVYDELSFPNTVQVTQRDFKTAVNDEFVFEIYADGVGLVERYHRVLFTRLNYLNDPSAENIIDGNEFNWKLIEYGEE